MEIDSKKIPLCNLEVLSLLNDLKTSTEDCGTNVSTILYETTQYLNEHNGHQSDADIKKFMKQLLDFPVQFSYNEKLMLINTPPKTPLELSLLISNCDERLTEEQINELLNLTNNLTSEEDVNIKEEALS